MDKNEIEIKPPNISPSTKKEMEEFFWKTSFPRILAEQAQKEKEARA